MSSFSNWNGSDGHSTRKKTRNKTIAPFLLKFLVLLIINYSVYVYIVLLGNIDVGHTKAGMGETANLYMAFVQNAATRAKKDNVTLPLIPLATTANINLTMTGGSEIILKQVDVDTDHYRMENVVFANVLERSRHSEKSCEEVALPSDQVDEEYRRKRKLVQRRLNHWKGDKAMDELEGATNITDLPKLEEFGVIKYIEDTLPKVQSRSPSLDSNIHEKCLLPPEVSCDVSEYTIILMAHSMKSLSMMLHKIRSDLLGRTHMAEVVLVWNGKEGIEQFKNDKYGVRLVSLHDDPASKFRFFLSFEHGLGNHLMNRYHPSINPKTEALLFFDDDGPWFIDEAVVSGFELWRRNSDVQIGAMMRRFEVADHRQVDLLTQSHHLAMDRVLNPKAHPFTSPPVNVSSPFQPQHIPNCRSRGDYLGYNYQDIRASFSAHVSLPSGSFLHRNYMCFLWHPAFAEIREFVRVHKVHPDDISVSVIVSQLSGKSPRVYPRFFHKSKSASTKEEARKIDLQKSEKKEQEHHRRKLLWQDYGSKANWAHLREEAMNNIVNYFGSISYGSVGFCLGIDNHVYKKGAAIGTEHSCFPYFLWRDYVPWLLKGGLENDTCQQIPKKRR